MCSVAVYSIESAKLACRVQKLDKPNNSNLRERLLHFTFDLDSGHRSELCSQNDNV